MRKIIILIVTVFTMLTGCSEYKTDAYETIGLEDILSKQQAGYIVLDVREVVEYDEGHIPDALNKPLSEIEKNNYADLTKDLKYVIICRSGNRSKKASEILHKDGFQVINVREGISSWPGEITRNN